VVHQPGPVGPDHAEVQKEGDNGGSFDGRGTPAGDPVAQKHGRRTSVGCPGRSAALLATWATFPTQAAAVRALIVHLVRALLLRLGGASIFRKIARPGEHFEAPTATFEPGRAWMSLCALQ